MIEFRISNDELLFEGSSEGDPTLPDNTLPLYLEWKANSHPCTLLWLIRFLSKIAASCALLSCLATLL